MKKQFKFILNVLMWIFIIIAVSVTIITLNTKEKGVSNFFGYIPFSIQSNSMQPILNKGDLIISQKASTDTLKKGDVISFFSVINKEVVIITHRIEQVNNNRGVISYITKGDNNLLPDANEVAPGDVISKYNGIMIPKCGYVLDFFRSKVGFFICIIIPLFILFVFQLVNFIFIVSKVNQNGIKYNN